MTAIELTEDEKKLLQQDMTDQEIERIRRLTLATQGKPLGDSTVPEILIDVQNIRERSRYPNFGILALIVYLNNIAGFNPNLKAYRVWANTLSESLISYKGLGRIEALDTKKAIQGTTQQFNIGQSDVPEAPTPMKKAHFWSKAPKQEPPSEFKE